MGKKRGITVLLREGLTFAEVDTSGEDLGEQDISERLWVEIFGNNKFMLGVVYIQPGSKTSKERNKV